MESKVEKIKPQIGKKSCKGDPEIDDISTVDSALAISMIKSISHLLEEIVEESEAEPLPSPLEKNIQKVSHIPSSSNYRIGNSFIAKKPPSISIYAYFDRIVKYTHIEDSTIITSLVYIDRLCEVNNIQLSKFNIHRILLASVLLSLKYNEDDYYSNTFYAKVGGISLKEINLLEFEFMKLMQYDLFVQEEIYLKYKEYLLNY